MPNHVVNEVVFRDVDQATQERLLAECCNGQGEVDFSILMPIPDNVQGDTERLTWCNTYWGTKWNAIVSRPVERTDDTLTLRFDTAWSPPFSWLAAVFFELEVDFDHNWLEESADRGVEASFIHGHGTAPIEVEPSNWSYIETECSDSTQRRLYELLFGQAWSGDSRPMLLN